MKVRKPKKLIAKQLKGESIIPLSPQVNLQSLLNNDCRVSENLEIASENFSSADDPTNFEMGTSVKKIFSYTEPEIRDSNKDIKPRWYISYYEVFAEGVKRHIKVYGQINRKHTVESRTVAARELLVKTIEKIKLGSVTSHSPLEDLLREKFLQKKTSSSWRKKTIESYSTKIEIFYRWCRSQKIISVTQMNRAVMNQFFLYLRNARANSNATVNDYRMLLRSLFKLFAKNIFPDDSFDDIKKLSEHPTSYLNFQPEQKRQIVKYLQKNDPWLLFFLQFEYYTLQRPGREIPEMKVSDIEFSSRRIRVDGARSKNRKEQRVQIPNQLAPIIKKSGILNYPPNYYVFGKTCPQENKVGRDYFSKRFKKVLKILGYGPGYVTYSWMHTGTIDFYKKTKDILALKEQKRHHSLEMLYNYLRQHGLMGFESLENNYPKM